MFSASRRVSTPTDTAGIVSSTSIATIRSRIQSISMKRFGAQDTVSACTDSENAALNDVHSTIGCGASGTDSTGHAAVAAINGPGASANGRQFEARIGVRHKF